MARYEGKEAVEWVQRQLAAAGYYKGTVDGKFWEGSQASLQVALADAAVGRNVVEVPMMKGLVKPDAFYNHIRGSLFGGKLSSSQFEGIENKLAAMVAANWPLSWVADGLGTSFLESNQTMQPVREAYWLSESWRKANLRYYPWYGRGDVQLTWDYNYALADEKLGLNGALIAKPDLAMDPKISAQIMVKGMSQGWFTGKKLGDYLPDRIGTFEQYKQSRRIINGMDRWTDLASYCLHFQEALVEGEYA